MKPRFFATPAAFRAWLEKHHARAPELLVGFRKKHSGQPSITWPDAVDQALCFGWIDGVRKRVDDASYTIRFTPRRSGSTWSAVNIARATALEEQGLMRDPGRRALEQRSEAKSRTYSYEQSRPVPLAPRLQARIEKSAEAWAFLQAQAPSYQRRVVHWVMSARREATRITRIDELIAMFERGRKV